MVSYNKMMVDSFLALVLFAAASYYLVQRKLASMIVWIIVIYLVASKGARLSDTLSVVVGLLGVYLISMITMRTWEHYENEEKESKPEGAPEKTHDPHVDVGTTILHAYRNLTPEQLGGMRRDTKELMELQKELMGSLAEMKPAIEQGAQLLQTFGTFFGKAEGGA